ncbi:unnamed protein product [Orchesella dallaii]|uniref:Uncharacterized protein n=1 Tax=Orchesella dallaii TaxID=48710 RepID=A0ABP1S199_9HEXA
MAFRRVLSETKLEGSEPKTADNYYKEISCAIKHAANESKMVKTFSPLNERSEKNQPWYDRHCRASKRAVQTSLRTCKRSRFESEYLKTYLRKKDEYQKIIEEKRHEYHIVLAGLICVGSSAITGGRPSKPEEAENYFGSPSIFSEVESSDNSPSKSENNEAWGGRPSKSENSEA